MYGVFCRGLAASHVVACIQLCIAGATLSNGDVPAMCRKGVRPLHTLGMSSSKPKPDLPSVCAADYDNMCWNHLPWEAFCCATGPRMDPDEMLEKLWRELQ